MELPESLSRLSSSVSLKTLQSYFSTYRDRKRLVKIMFDRVISLRTSAGVFPFNDFNLAIINMDEDGGKELYLEAKKGGVKCQFRITNARNAQIDNRNKKMVKVPNDCVGKETIFFQFRSPIPAMNFAEKVNESLAAIRGDDKGGESPDEPVPSEEDDKDVGLPNEPIPPDSGSADGSSSPTSDPAACEEEEWSN